MLENLLKKKQGEAQQEQGPAPDESAWNEAQGEKGARKAQQAQAQAPQQPKSVGAEQAESAGSTGQRLQTKGDSVEQLALESDKLGAELAALRGIEQQESAQVQSLAVGLGELRSMVMQRERVLDELKARIEQLTSIVSALEPEKVTKRLDEREREITLTQMRVEKAERLTADLLKSIKDVQKTLENVRSLENARELGHEIETKAYKMEEVRASVERSSNRVETIYREIDRRLVEFGELKDKMLRLDALSKELMKATDEIKIKMEGLVQKEDVPSRADIDSLRKDFANVRQEIDGLHNKIINQRVLMREHMATVDDAVKKASVQPSAAAVQKEVLVDAAEANPLIAAPVEEEQKPAPAPKRGAISISVETAEQQARPMPSPAGAAEPEMQRIEAELRELQGALQMLDEEYRQGVISEGSYNEAKANSEVRLAELEERLRRVSQGEAAEAPAEAAKPAERTQKSMQKLQDDSQRVEELHGAGVLDDASYERAKAAINTEISILSGADREHLRASVSSIEELYATGMIDKAAYMRGIAALLGTPASAAASSAEQAQPLQQPPVPQRPAQSASSPQASAERVQSSMRRIDELLETIGRKKRMFEGV
jgi:chromosome segregation ATPase